MLSTGCGQNALMNPVGQTEVGSGSTARNDLNPAKNDLNPARNDLNP
jgi:hypothetical protein